MENCEPQAVFHDETICNCSASVGCFALPTERVHVCVHACACRGLCVCVCVHVLHMHACACVCVCMCAHVCMCACVCACVCICVCALLMLYLPVDLKRSHVRVWFLLRRLGDTAVVCLQVSASCGVALATARASCESWGSP